MRITDVTQQDLSFPLDGSFEPTWIPGYPQANHEVSLFEIETDAGLTGITASPSFAGGIDYEEPLSYFLVGEDPHDIRGIRRKLDSFHLLGPRPWHVEVALWDIIGKDAGKPLYEILGGTAEPIPAYASTGEVMAASERTEYIENIRSKGFETLKLRIRTSQDVDIVRDIRESFPDLTLVVDANKGWAVRALGEETRWSLAEAVQVARDLEEIGGVGWLEEPLPRHDIESYAELRRQVDIPIGGGEFADGISTVRRFLDTDAVDVLQPDVMLATGIKGGITIGSRAMERGVSYVPHTWTNGIGLIANLHVMAATDAPWCEFPYEPPWTPRARDFMLESPIRVSDGEISPPDGPGLGLDLDRSAVTEYAT